eukprot:212516_1
MRMSQNVRSRRSKLMESDLNEVKIKTETPQRKFARYIVQFTVLGLISIIIFYSVKFIYIGFFGTGFNNKIQDTNLTDDVANELGVYWTQPVISLDLIPNNIFTTSDTDECKDTNSKWKYNSFTPEEALNTVHEELDIAVDTLQKLSDNHKLDVTDVFKFVIMNKYGGFYIDRKAECKTKSIDEWFQYYYPTKHIHYNNYILTYQLLEANQMNKFVNVDMIIAFETAIPFGFGNWAFFSKPNNPILHFVIDSYVEYITKVSVDTEVERTVEERRAIHVGPGIFTEAIEGFVDAFTNDRQQALLFHKFEDGKSHVITLYINEEDKDGNNKETNKDIINILVVPLPDMWKIAGRKRFRPKHKPQ